MLNDKVQWVAGQTSGVTSRPFSFNPTSQENCTVSGDPQCPPPGSQPTDSEPLRLNPYQAQQPQTVAS